MATPIPDDKNKAIMKTIYGLGTKEQKSNRQRFI